jgi:3-phenylpropionate/trans-cinnamate dioxygenase ferredoxin component
MGEWVAACRVDDVGRGEAVPFVHDGEVYTVYRSHQGEYYVTDGYCTHGQQLLCDGMMVGPLIECPLHGGWFDYTTGRALGPPVMIDLATYPTKVDGGTVFIELGGPPAGT